MSVKHLGKLINICQSYGQKSDSTFSGHGVTNMSCLLIVYCTAVAWNSSHMLTMPDLLHLYRLVYEI